MQLLIDLIAIVLAAGAVIDIWRNGSLFEEARAYMEARADTDGDVLPAADDTRPYAERYPHWVHLCNKCLPDWIVCLLNCSYCMGPHAAFWWLVYLVPSLWMAEPWAIVYKVPLYAFAAFRLGFIIDAKLPRRARYEREREVTVPADPLRVSPASADPVCTIESWKQAVAEQETLGGYQEWITLYLGIKNASGFRTGQPGATCPHCGQDGIQNYDQPECPCPRCNRYIGHRDEPGFPRSEWQQAVENDETIDGYLSWVAEKRKTQG